MSVHLWVGNSKQLNAFLYVQAWDWTFQCLEEMHSSPGDWRNSGWEEQGGFPQLETCYWESRLTMQPLVHAFQSVFTCSGDENPLHLSELVKSKIDIQGCLGDRLVDSVWRREMGELFFPPHL